MNGLNPETRTGTVPDHDLAIRRRRLRFRAQHRGTREMDLLLGQFAEAALAQLTDLELTAFEGLMEMRDSDVLDWLTGRRPVPAEFETPLFAKLRAFHTHPHPLYR
jgi:antitoxin CptB